MKILKIKDCGCAFHGESIFETIGDFELKGGFFENYDANLPQGTLTERGDAGHYTCSFLGNHMVYVIDEGEV